MRILVIRLGAVGDVVRCLPALELLRRGHEGAELCWLAEPGPAGVLEGHPALDELLIFRRGGGAAGIREVVSSLRRQTFDLAIDFHGILKSALFALVSGAPRRMGFAGRLAREGSGLFYTERVPPPEDPWRVGQFLALARGAVAEPSGTAPQPRVPVEPAERERVDAFFARHGLGERKVVLLYPGSSPGAGWKRWPEDRYRLLGQRLAATGAADVLVGWGPGEEEIAARVCEGGAETLVRTPPTSLRELAEILRRVDLFVGADTGPAHLAGAVGTRVLGIYGASDAGRNRPIGDGHVLLTRGEPLRPRPWTRSKLEERTASITADEVYDRAAALLEPS